ncbi:Clathrin/coatomer adaptor adaptin-like N-terminal [Arabidopsis thaliana x Arabidopsis arenosa]|uniref:AP-3 complex subunit delta n=1 Tax=Arabidopsis thaliana x Arabidopsis arenosa TaxID=1240361 RepID=A0A8T2AU33_9BRAS|nr:Clathrin/coatomer adaptor adaptin-like N-terminal [Arabidopsis thaliana x Arabidopsis arenosa]
MASSNSLMDNLFQRSLEDLIKGLRLQLLGESFFISKSLEEIRREIKSTDLSTKSIALQKLSYLAALHGVDMSWAAFHAVEVVSSSRFSDKRIGYHAITQSFNDQTPVLLLITNQLRKDLNSSNEYEVSLALECLSRIGTDDLARDLTSEVFTLLGSSKVLVRKKAIGVVLRVFDKYPDAVKVCFKRLVENLESSDPQILSAVVGVFCELTTKDPRSYLPLAPEFYKILVDSRNNWDLIKVLKIFAKLALVEPRLAKKVADPICELMRRTVGKSLLFECIRTVVSSLSDQETALKLAVAKIREFLVDDDRNLKYLGLHALSIVAPKHLWAVLENKEAVVKALSDEDPNVKLEALHLLMSMVNEDNVSEISRILMNYALKSDPFFCNEIIASILLACSRNSYEIIVDFDWYLSLLGEMARIPHCQRGQEIGHQLIDIGTRVKDARLELVRVSRALLIDPALLGNQFLHPILSAAAWASGEYVEFSKTPYEIAEALLQPRTSLLAPSVRAIYIHSTFKVLVFSLAVYFSAQEPTSSPLVEESTSSGSSPVNGITYKSISSLVNMIELGLCSLSGTLDVEVQERAKNVLGFIGMIKHKIAEKVTTQESETEASRAVAFMEDVFSEELGPVTSTAQEKVPLPDGLELKESLEDLQEICGEFLKPVVDSNSNSNSFSSSENISFSVAKLRISDQKEASSSSSHPPESASLLAEHRKRHGLYYLSSQKNDDHNDNNGDNNNTLNEYPPANEISVDSFNTKKKMNQSKQRPVVVQLDEGDGLKTKPDASNNDEPLSRAIQTALMGKGKEKEREKDNPERDLDSRIKGRSSGREKKTKKKNGEKSSKHRSRRRSDKEASAAEPVEIPDFLL